MMRTSWRKVHCIGIGGIGISALARFLRERSATVTGSDLVGSQVTLALMHAGVRVQLGPHSEDHLPKNVDAVVYSPAISHDNVEYQAAKWRGIPVLSYPQALAELTKGHDAVVVTGTHGKSTTSAMIGISLVDANTDPSIIVGSLVPALDSNVRVGNGKLFVLEGDEYQRSFLAYTPHVLVVTNIEADHLDYYKDLGDIMSAFHELARRVPAEGLIVANGSDDRVREICKNASARVVFFSSPGPYHVLPFPISLPGKHNVMNALAAYTALSELRIPNDTIKHSLSSFTPIWRRFEVRGTVHGVTIIDDYAHHPTEIRATLQAAREAYPDAKIWCIFQPHQRSRTRALFEDFAHAFSEADHLLLTDIYLVAGREPNDDLTARDLLKAIPRPTDARYVPSFDQAVQAISTSVRPGDVVITMGAGTITELSGMLVAHLTQQLKD